MPAAAGGPRPRGCHTFAYSPACLLIDAVRGAAQVKRLADHPASARSSYRAHTWDIYILSREFRRADRRRIPTSAYRRTCCHVAPERRPGCALAHLRQVHSVCAVAPPHAPLHWAPVQPIHNAVQHQHRRCERNPESLRNLQRGFANRNTLFGITQKEAVVSCELGDARRRVLVIGQAGKECRWASRPPPPCRREPREGACDGPGRRGRLWRAAAGCIRSRSPGPR
jgi:hypothetical protein